MKQLLATTLRSGSALFCCAILCFPFAAHAQSVAWEESPHASDLAGSMARLQVVLDQLTPDQWLAKGASDTYISQWQRTREDLAALTETAHQLDQQPKKLSLALDTYFRLQSIEWNFESLIRAVRTYQNPAIGDVMESMLRSNATHRDALRAYIMTLAARQEQQFTIADTDAQSCREELAKIPMAARRTPQASKPKAPAK